MTSKELCRLLESQHPGESIRQGYNYAVFAIVCRGGRRTVDAVADAIIANRAAVEAAYRDAGIGSLELLPVVLRRPRCVLVPIPFGASLNGVSDAIQASGCLAGLSCRVPAWS